VRSWHDLLAAFAFLTRLPTPRYSHDALTLARASKFFPLVGLVLTIPAYAVYLLLSGHAATPVRCVLVLCLLIFMTGGLHEDGLADVADGFGGGWTRDRALEIMRDSRIGTYGALALILSVMVRFVLLTSLNPERFWPYLASAQILCRWSTLPLSFLLPAARRAEGKGASIAQKVSRPSFVFGTILMVVLCVPLLKLDFWAPLLSSIVVVFLSASYYRHRIGGLTGDCFGATNQLVEIAIYLCGVLGGQGVNLRA
jgi:adenosylcobinamide-GDP ribazoletransferase